MSEEEFFLDTAKEEDDEQEYSLIPAGEYPVVVEECSFKESRAGNLGISATYTICGDQYVGRKLFEWFNWNHPTPKVQKIARSELTRLTRAAYKGEHQLTNPNDLVGKSVIAKVSIQKGGGMDGEDANSVKGYKPYEGIINTKEEVSQEVTLDDDDIPY